MNSKSKSNPPEKKELIIEDEGTICLLLNILLDGHGLQLGHVQTLLAGKEYLKTERPSLVTLDNKLPDGFGVDFIHFLKSGYPEVQIIMISRLGASVKDMAKENGANIFLEKHFSKEALFKAVDQLIHVEMAS